MGASEGKSKKTTRRIPFPTTLLEFQQWFSEEEACVDYLYQSRWPEGFVCPKCGSRREAYRIEAYGRIECAECRHQTSVTAGTVMHGTRMPLRVWFNGAYLVTTHTPGFSALQFQRQLGIKTYETAFQMLHKLRAAMVRPDRDRIHGDVEVDESFIGAKKPGKRGRGAAGKVMVAGAVEVLERDERKERVGRLRLQVVADGSADSLVGFVLSNVQVGSEVRTDGLISYNKLAKKGYSYKIVESRDLEHIHKTFGNLKTWIEGTHHGVSKKHMQAYVNEFVFRHNRRRTPMAAFQTVLGLAAQTEGLTYADLYAAGSKGRWKHPNS
jgi:transposase-like protein